MIYSSNISKQQEKVDDAFLSLEDLLKGTNIEVTIEVPANRFSHLPQLVGKKLKIRPLTRQEYRTISDIGEKPSSGGWGRAANILVFKALTYPKLSREEDVDKALGGIVDWIAEQVNKISGMYVEKDEDLLKNSIK